METPFTLLLASPDPLGAGPSTPSLAEAKCPEGLLRICSERVGEQPATLQFLNTYKTIGGYTTSHSSVSKHIQHQPSGLKKWHMASPILLKNCKHLTSNHPRLRRTALCPALQACSTSLPVGSAAASTCGREARRPSLSLPPDGVKASSVQLPLQLQRQLQALVPSSVCWRCKPSDARAGWRPRFSSASSASVGKDTGEGNVTISPAQSKSLRHACILAVLSFPDGAQQISNLREHRRQQCHAVSHCLFLAGKRKNWLEITGWPFCWLDNHHWLEKGKIPAKARSQIVTCQPRRLERPTTVSLGLHVPFSISTSSEFILSRLIRSSQTRAPLCAAERAPQ